MGTRGHVLTVLDASALVALLIDEPARPAVESLLRRRPPPSISAVNLGEVIDSLVRGHGHHEELVRDRIDLLMVGGLEIEPVWLGGARLAASLRVQHYRRARSAVSMADCFCLATAIALETDLATTDPALAQMARAVGVAVVALPDSTGTLP
ncbi:MAG: PIN domain-containing protein [Candidatus Limnocylindrales bacterium]